MKQNGCERGTAPARRSVGQKGFSLIEVLASLVIFALGLLGLVGLQAIAADYSVDSENARIAATLANNLGAQMWALNTVNLPAATVSGSSAGSCQTMASNLGLSTGGLPGAPCSVSVDTTGKIATITVSWKTPYKQSIDSTKPNYVPSTGDQYVTVVQIP